jgi:hypothetical protein
MKLLKFNLIFIPCLALCLGVVGYIARTVLVKFQFPCLSHVPTRN